MRATNEPNRQPLAVLALVASITLGAACATSSTPSPKPQARPDAPVADTVAERAAAPVDSRPAAPAETGQDDIGLSSTGVAESTLAADELDTGDAPVPVGWVVNATEQTPHTGRTFQLKVRQGAKGPAGSSRRYKLELVAGRKRHRVVDDFIEIRVPRGVKKVKLTINDPKGGTYSDSFSVNRNTKTIIEVTSKWAHAGYRGEFVNNRGDCRRAKRREKLRFSVWITRDLQIGDWVEVKPGKRRAGPRLGDGSYSVRIERRKRGRWVLVRKSRMTVNGKGWRSVAGCGVKG